MGKTKPDLRKMFDIHTAVILVVTVVLLLSCTSQARVQDAHRQSHHNHHRHLHHQHHHNNHHLQTHYDDAAIQSDEKSRHHQHNPQQHTTPSIESTTNNSGLASDGDNEPTIKVDDELYTTITMNSLTSTTSTPSRQHDNHKLQPEQQQLHHHQLEKPSSNQRNGQHLILNTSGLSSSSSSFSNSIVEHHTHQQSENRLRLVTTPLPPLQSYFLSATTQQYNHNGGGNQRRSSATNPLERSKYSSYSSDAMERDNYSYRRPPGRPHHPAMPQEYDYDLLQQQLQQHQQPKPEEDYYEEYNDDDDDEDDDIDGFIDDTDNNLSDRSYARITRSKLDDDYADDEPYRNAVEDQMQRDAPPGVLTDQKYLEVGNEKAVHQARERYIQEQKRPRTPHELATEHWQRMIHATKCRKPLPRVIPVSNNTSKRYEPYATILHRCGEDTGCCGSTASVCTVKRYEIVMVYVFSYDFNYRKEIEALPMHNHTECHCVNRASLQQDGTPRGKRSGGSWKHQQQLPPQHPASYHSPAAQSSHRSDIKMQQHHAENMLSCHCPRHFSVFEEDVERYAHLPRPHTVFTRKCRCDCQSNNQTCLRFKHGEEGFSLEDRKCIMEHNCKPPVCSFGDYNVQSGRCPAYRGHNTQQL